MADEKYKDEFERRNISRVSFGLDNASQIQKQAHVCVLNTELYKKDDPQRSPVEYGLLDRRMGLNKSQKDVYCQTCSKDLWDCVGHFGYIDLRLPVYHYGFLRYIFDILQTICKNCSHVMLNPQKCQEFRDKVSKASLSYVTKKSLRKQIFDIAKKTKNCPYCEQRNGVVKKSGMFKFVYENPYSPNSSDVHENDEVAKNINSLIVLNQIDVMNLLERIPQTDIPLLLMNPSCGHPKDFVLTRIPVPPVCIRPSPAVEDGTREDDLTHKLSEILLVNNGIDYLIQSGVGIEDLVDCWDQLQYHCAWYINGQLSIGPCTNMVNTCTKTLVQRLRGKKGRFRQNLSGKRVIYTARSVISPNPNLKINEVGVPLDIAKQLTYAEYVTKRNIHLMKKLVRNGPDVYPGANGILNKGKIANKYVSFTFYDNMRAAKELIPGERVERHLQDGDIVLFNRQPSLHKLSIMAHKVRVLKTKTLTLNECVCAPYNADFDGDEMNIHVPQTEEAKAEALFLMDCNSNLVSPRDGTLSMGAIQDFITGSYLLTQKDVFLNRDQVWNLAACLLSEEDVTLTIDIPQPAICKPVKLWTGKQIFRILLRPNNTCGEKVNLSVKKSRHTDKYELCADDSHVIIHNSDLLAGYLDKSVLGSGSKISLFYIALRDYGKDYAAKCMWRLCRLVSYYVTNKGLSFGIGDVIPTEELKKAKKQKCSDKLEIYNIQNTDVGKQSRKHKLKSLASESKMVSKLSGIRDELGKECINKLHSTNAPRIMAVCGSKGSRANVSQMISCVGQQVINNHRISHGFTNRSFPHFKCNSSHPKSKGFVENSFNDGLSPIEFFFHAIAGREGLIDSSVKTSETGYMQRQLMKSMEDLCVQYDGSVRNSLGNVVQLTYGDDGFDPAQMETKENPINFQRVFNHIRNKYPYKNEACLDSLNISEFDIEFMNRFSHCSTHFKNILLEFLNELGQRLSNTTAGRITESQIKKFLDICYNTYMRAIIDPGSAVGANSAQSIGEPATQMTLKIFHFAGLASMNVTQGIPRLKQIINAFTKTRDSVISVVLDKGEPAKEVKNRIQKTYLGDICSIHEISLQKCSVLVLKLNQKKVDKKRITCKLIKEKIISTNKLKLKDDMVTVMKDKILIEIKKNNDDDLQFHLTMMSEELSKIIVKGLPSAKSVTKIDMEDRASIPFDLMVDGSSLRDIMATIGVDGINTISNNPIDVLNALGIEAARTSIITEITQVMENHEVNIDQRHLMLLADLMTSCGEVLGVSRFGFTKTKESVLDQASFETTINSLFDAAYYGQANDITGISESIIVGAPISVGTSLFELYPSNNA